MLLIYSPLVLKTNPWKQKQPKKKNLQFQKFQLQSLFLAVGAQTFALIANEL